MPASAADQRVDRPVEGRAVGHRVFEQGEVVDALDDDALGVEPGRCAHRGDERQSGSGHALLGEVRWTGNRSGAKVSRAMRAAPRIPEKIQPKFPIISVIR